MVLSLADCHPETIIHTDGSTDLGRVVEVLCDQFILMGDVPALLLARGSVEEVEDYCLNLIGNVWKTRRLILSSGCDVPMDASMHNVRTMIKTARMVGNKH